MERIKLGFIGCGAHSSKSLQPNVPVIDEIDFVAVADLDEGRAKKSAERYGVKPYTDFKEMISRSFQRYPVRIKSLQIDGGPEFANSILEEYAKQRGIELLSSRPYHKNDQAHVEERQLHVVRSFVGRDRIDTQAEIEVLGWLYRNLELLLNLFTPRLMAKAIVETETGRRKRIYDEPKTPLERLLPYLPEDKARELVELRDSLNPVFLMKEINRARKTLYELMREKGSRVGTLPLARRGSKKH